MTIVVRDLLDRLERELRSQGKKPKVIEIDINSYAALREELGLEFDEDLTQYHGYPIKVNASGSEIIRYL